MSANPSRRLVFSTYRRLLRLQRKLPHEMQAVGNEFIRQEFKRHKEASEEHAKKFMKEWKNYAQLLEEQLGVASSSSNPKSSAPSPAHVGRNFTTEELELLGDDQTVQLYELKKETSKPVDPKSPP